MNDTVEFTPEAVKQYLVAAVQKWRKRKLDAPGIGGPDWLEAVCYVDAFQSVVHQHVAQSIGHNMPDYTVAIEEKHQVKITSKV